MLIYKGSQTNPNSIDQGFRITKSFKESTGRLKCISMYFIIDGIIFQAATLRAVLEERLERASYLLNNAIKNIHKNGKYSLKQKVPWKEEAKDEEFDYDFLYEDSQSAKIEKMLDIALDSIDDL